jgi:hypothetical protein
MIAHLPECASPQLRKGAIAQTGKFMLGVKWILANPLLHKSSLGDCEESGVSPSWDAAAVPGFGIGLAETAVALEHSGLLVQPAIIGIIELKKNDTAIERHGVEHNGQSGAQVVRVGMPYPGPDGPFAGLLRLAA